MQIVITLSDSDHKAEVAALLSHLQEFYSTPNAKALFVAQPVAKSDTPDTPEQPKQRKPRAPKADPVAAYNEIAAASGAPVVDPAPNAAVAEVSRAFDVVTDPAPIVVATIEETFDFTATSPAQPERTPAERREFVRNAILAKGLASAMTDFVIPRGCPPIPQWSDAEIDRVYALATA